MNLTIFPCTLHVPCDTFNCRTMAKWFIARADGPISSNAKHCDDCTRHMLSNLPEELSDAVGITPPEPVVVETPPVDVVYQVLHPEGEVLYCGIHKEKADEALALNLDSVFEIYSDGKAVDFSNEHPEGNTDQTNEDTDDAKDKTDNDPPKDE